MQSRFLAGWRGLTLAALVAGVVVLSTAMVFASPTPLTTKVGDSDAITLPSEPTVRPPVTFPRSNYIWPYSTGPHYGEVDASQWGAPGVLHTMVGSFDLTRGLPAFPSELRTTNKLNKAGAQYFLLQVVHEAFGDGRFDAIRDAITSSGGALVQDMPIDGFIARLNQGGFAAIQGMPGILTLEPYHPAFKLEPSIGRVPLLDPASAVSEVYRLDVQIFRGEDSMAVAQALKDLGANVIGISPEFIRFEINRSRLAQVASLEPVFAVFEALPVLLHGQETSGTVQSGNGSLTGTRPYTAAGINGGGLAAGQEQILMVLDSGIQIDAGDLSNTRTDAGAAGPAHRKVRFYGQVNTWGGLGDLLGCDAPTSGGYTHGHVVSATALGNATQVPGGYGAGWSITDPQGNPWDFDGIAPRALLVAYDAQVTPSTLSCADPTASGLSIGTLWSAGTGSLEDAYTKGARVANFSFGSNTNTYGTDATQVDNFLINRRDAMVFISAGNASADTNGDARPDDRTTGTPASAKNAVTVGASDAASGSAGNNRASFSSVGPATLASLRVAPILMAPGIDYFAVGFGSEYACKTADNDQTNAVECTVSQNSTGTSFASPAAAGAALVVRDYFRQGFYPDKTNGNAGNSADVVSNVSGALVKATLVASAQFMGSSIVGSTPGINVALGGNLTQRPRMNNEQGYGRILLTNVLPLTTATSPAGLIICDGAIGGGKCDTSGISGSIGNGQTQNYTLKVLDKTKELRIALAWPDGTSASESLVNNLDLIVCPPSNAGCASLTLPGGRAYYGNFFSEDKNFNRALDSGETNCDYSGQPWPPNSTGVIDNSVFSIPACAAYANSSNVGNHDNKNPVEAVFLSPDPAGNGQLTGNDGDNQLEIGDWTVRIVNRSSNTQDYAIVMAGPVGLGSSTRVSRIRPDGAEATGSFVCNDSAKMVVQEFADATDTDLTTGNNNATEVKSRAKLEVIDPGPDGACNTGDDIVKDTESTSLTWTDLDGAGAGLKYESDVKVLTNATAFQDNNGALDIRNGYCVRAVYADETSSAPDPDKRRTSASLVDCRTLIASGGVVWGNFGRDAFTLVDGGCEKDKRGWFTFGFPDKYMDQGEKVGYRIAFQSVESADLDDVQVSLKAVAVDGDSPRDCAPNSVGTCADPTRSNNAISPYLSILDSPKTIGRVWAGAAVSANFLVEVTSGAIPAATEIEMLLGVSARKAGKPVESYAVSRHKLDVDETTFFYSTDFITGGTQDRDTNDNETIEDPTSAVLDTNFRGDYRDESFVFSNAQATGRNTGLNTPWNFDANDGGFRSGLNLTTNYTNISTTIAQWGEDRDFDNVLDGGEDRDPSGGAVPDQAWSTLGGCGWQTRTTGATGGAWHTGLIRSTTPSTCTRGGALTSRCQTYETVGGFQAQNVWWELLTTPKFEKVHQCPTGTEFECNGRADAVKDPTFQVEFTNWAWNLTMDIKDVVSGMTWELDTNPDPPIDLINDNSILNSLFGTQGAVSGGNAPLSDGFSLFANISSCQETGFVDALQNPIKTCGGLVGGTSCTNDTPCTGASLNGSVNNNRNGSNNCFFEGKTSGVAKAQQPYGLARPRDNDTSDGWCGRTDSMNGIDRQKSCDTANDCQGSPYNGVCNKDDAIVDNYVTANGPIRNFDITQANGVDMRYSILEDFYGDSGKTFQGAIGFYTQEGSGTAALPNSGFGLAVDDVVIEWREFRLDPDSTTCGAGAGKCAVLNIASTNFFEGNSFVQLSVLDDTPYAPGSLVNDCNNDGDYVDAGDDNDCNNNGKTDVTVKVTSEAEPTGEIAILDRVGTTAEYRGNMPISSSYNSSGVLFLSRTGTDQPTVTARYFDRDTDGVLPVLECQNDPDPAKRGTIFNSTTVFVDAGRIALTGIKVDDDNLAGTAGDNDGFPDTNETVDVTLTFTNKSGATQEQVVASIQSDSKYCVDTGTKVAYNACSSQTDCTVGRTCTPVVECISVPTVSVGTMGTDACANPPGGDTCRTKTAPGAFRFKVADITRNAVGDTLDVVFVVSIRSKDFDVLTRRVDFALTLDLDASGGGAAQPFLEDFEGAGFGKFTSMELDAGKASVSGSNGYRCQYNDPAGPNPNDPGRTSCYLGFTTASSNAYDWHQHTTGADGGVPRAYDGTKSLHWGVHPSTGVVRDTTRFSQLDAIRTTNPIHVATGGASSPVLSFKHQISLTDSRITNTPAGEAADRAAVAIQLSDAGGAFIGNWIKILPYENEYDVQGTDNFLNCTFDPIDDGNDEDSFFDPSDSLRRTGPSTTCMPEFIFAWHGDTDWRNNPAILTNIGRSFDGPGLAGATGPGTWIEPKFSLFGYKGKSLRVRFLATSIEVGGAITVNDTNIGADNETGDDGWYIDQVALADAVASPATLVVDNAANSGFPACPTCNTITPVLSATPTSTIAPGQPVKLDASASSANACPSGTLQYQFWNDANTLNGVGGVGDVLLRDWTDNAILNDAPTATTRFAVIVRCSTATTCDAGSNSIVTPVTVGCPSTGPIPAATKFASTVSFDATKQTLSWSPSQSFDLIRGDLVALQANKNYTGTVLSCLANDQTGTSYTDAATPSGGQAWYYLIRPGGPYFCNAPTSWTPANITATTYDSQINADGNVCP